MNNETENKGVIYEFGKFVLNPQERVLLADGKAVHLTDKIFDTLLLLIQHNGRLLTKDEMMTTLWEESFVEESNLAKNISRLRKILNADGNELIETLPKRGYRLSSDVKEIDGSTSLLVRRNLRVKITRTIEDEPFDLPREKKKIPQLAAHKPRSKRFLIPLVVLPVVIFSALGFYFWKRGESVVNAEVGAIRLTDNTNQDSHPRWTKDGRIRFLRTGGDKQVESVVMNADGANQTAVKDFNNLDYGFWSPDETKVIFVKRGDKTALYLANADGSNEVSLPFFGGNVDWSPDSKTIVYQKNVSAGDPDIFVYSLETAESKNVTNNPAFDADPSFSPDGKQIVFASLRDGNAEIYLMNSDGSDVRRLTNHPAWDSHPVFSPDGTTIAFPSNRDNESSDVYLMNADGSGIRRLTDWQANESVEPGCWSPDGTKIAFVSDRDGSDDIFVISAEIYRPRLVLGDAKSDLQFASASPGGKQIVFQAETDEKKGEIRIFDTESKQTRVVLKTENADIAPVLSPDGTLIAFQNRIEANTEICLIKTDGSGFTNLTNNAARDVSPAFSPDGKQIAFASNRDGNFGVFQLYVMNSDGSNQRRIYSGKQMSLAPAWSPDGKQIIFMNDKEDGGIGNFEIFSIDLDNAESEKRLTFRRRLDSQPAFSPDGNFIAFISEADGNAEVYLMNADGRNLIRLTRNTAEDVTPQFSKDGKRIIFSSNRKGKFAIYELEL